MNSARPALRRISKPACARSGPAAGVPATRTMIYLGLRPHELCTIDEISTAYGISSNHLMKVVQQAAQAGDVQTVRGQHGGIRLARAPEAINIGTVLRRQGCSMLDTVIPNGRVWNATVPQNRDEAEKARFRRGQISGSMHGNPTARRLPCHRSIICSACSAKSPTRAGPRASATSCPMCCCSRSWPW